MICEKCGNEHGDTFGEVKACLRAQIEDIGATHLLDQLDALDRDNLARIEAAIVEHFDGGSK